MSVAVMDRPKRGAAPPAPAEGTLQARYDRALAEVIRLGGRLEGPQAVALSPAAWEAEFRRYRRSQERLRRLGEELRPSTLRDRSETLSGAALTAEIAELFS